ncbi:Methionine aminopeptidase 1D, chloroplastic/mitochondrial [Hordeum vulgare]|nr:Methionine aminopeptidase 1D, chloroplastic/mitochondrial [Hordeum vulgare]
MAAAPVASPFLVLPSLSLPLSTSRAVSMTTRAHQQQPPPRHYTEEQIRRVEESIRIRREAEPVELVRAVKKLRKVFAWEEKRRKELPLELKLRVSYELVGRLNDLGDNGSTIQQTRYFAYLVPN